jgi:putative tricarboxylic transport membrane protein
MSFLLLGITLIVFSAASIVDAARISTNLRQPGVFDIVGPDRYLLGAGALLLVLGVGLVYQGANQLLGRAPRISVHTADSGSNTHLWLLGSIVLYAMLMPTVGYVIATLVFFLTAFRVMGMRNWAWILGSAVVVTASLAIIFTYAADMPLPRGWVAVI